MLVLEKCDEPNTYPVETVDQHDRSDDPEAVVMVDGLDEAGD